MPKKNQFSGLSEPDKDTCTESSSENIKRFREATLKLDRIHNADNERDIADNIIQLCKKYNKANLDIAWDLDYEDAMEMLEEVYNDVDANMMILAIEMLAKQYGYLPEMDEEVVDVEQEMFWYATETFPSLITRIQTEYASLTQKFKKMFTNKIASGMRSYEINKYNTRPKVERKQIWVVETPYGVGSETTGFRWSIIISNESHAKNSNTANVVFLDSSKATKKKYHLEITNEDLIDGALEKDPSRVNLGDIYTVDKKRIKDYKGKVSDEFMELLMKRIAMQLGMIAFPKELEANATSEEVAVDDTVQTEEVAADDVTQTEEAAAPKQQEEVSESDSE